MVFDGSKQIGEFSIDLPHSRNTSNCPSYANEENFFEEAADFDNHGRNVPTTLTIPRGKGPIPAVILVPGGGALLDRDSTIGSNKPFSDLALGLAGRESQ